MPREVNMRVLLINTNRMKPPIAPIGLEYVAQALHAGGHTVKIVDLCWEEDWKTALGRFLGAESSDLIGLTLRNTDDCAFTSRQSFLADFQAMGEEVGRHSSAPIVLGGVGFSVMPETILSRVGAEVGIWGEGEWTIVELANRFEEKREFFDLPNLIWRSPGGWRRNPALFMDLRKLPAMERNWLDHPRYFREGGQAGIETKRGCPGGCIYCADPVAKGRNLRLRPPHAVVEELENLLAQGIDHFHICDSEFNLPPDHAMAVCQAIQDRHLGERIRWYAYLSPVPFPPQLARAMAAAGCAGINFGVDSGDEGMLRRLGRDFRPEDIGRAARYCQETGMAVMFDLLIGAPGESEESIGRTMEMMKRIEPDLVGVAVGVRVYPGTVLARRLEGNPQGGLVGGKDPGDPLFFIEPRIASKVFDLLDERIGGDRRFFFFDPARPERNYNYNANQRLAEAIRQGYRGAYWDILRRIRDPSTEAGPPEKESDVILQEPTS